MGTSCGWIFKCLRIRNFVYFTHYHYYCIGVYQDLVELHWKATYLPTRLYCASKVQYLSNLGQLPCRVLLPLWLS